MLIYQSSGQDFFFTTIPIINAVSDQTGKLHVVIKVLIRYIQDIQWFDIEYGIYLMRRQDILYFHECESRVKI